MNSSSIWIAQASIILALIVAAIDLLLWRNKRISDKNAAGVAVFVCAFAGAGTAGLGIWTGAIFCAGMMVVFCAVAASAESAENAAKA